MKRFDKGYIYSSLVTDLLCAVAIVSIFLKDFFFNEETAPEDITAAIPFFVTVGAVICLFAVIYRILYYRASGYELTETELRCRRGVFFRKHSVLEYKKIHAVNKKQTIVHRIFGIAVLTVDSGSANTSHTAEITIVEKSATVDALSDRLNRMRVGEAVADADAAESPTEVLISERDRLYSFTSAKKMLYTLINVVTTVFFTACLAVLALTVLSVCKGLLRLDVLGTWGEYFLYALLITVGAMLLLAAISLVGSLLQSFVGYYGFTVTRRSGSLEISYGLFEKHTNRFQYDRIKAVKISQGLVARIFGFASIRLEVIGYTVSASDDNKNASLGVLVPFCRYGEVDEILARILPDYAPSKRQTRSAAFFPFVSWFLLTVGILTGILTAGTVAVMAVLHAPALAIYAVALAIFGLATLTVAFKMGSAILAYHNNGLAVEGEKLTVYSGGFTRTVTVFHAKHLIAVERVTTPLRKRRGIVSLVMHLKTNATSNEVKLHIQSDALSGELERILPL